MTKKNILKKVLAVSLAAMLTLGSIPLSGLSGISLPSIFSFSASAAEEEPVWTVATDDMLKIEGNTITGYTDSLSGNIEFPSKTANGTAITEIASRAFEGCSALTAVKIPDTIIKIGYSAFKNTGLETVYFNASNCKMGIFNTGNTNNETYSAFASNNNLENFIFGENVTSIPANVCKFASNLTFVEFKGEVTEIGNYAFGDCKSLGAIDLSKVTSIGYEAFLNCGSLRATDKNKASDEDNGTIVFSADLLTIGSCAFENCTSIKTVTIPENTTEIGYSAFKNTGLETVYFNATNCKMVVFNPGLSNDTNNEEHSAFASNNNLENFIFGENVTSIPANVCKFASNLTFVEFKGEVTEIGKYAFGDCKLLKAIDLSKVTSIGYEAFLNCYSLRATDKNKASDEDNGTIVFSADLSTIGSCAFENCTSIKTVTIPENTAEIGYSAFKKTGLETVYFNATNCKMGIYNTGDTNNEEHCAFASNNNLENFIFGENVTSIPANVCKFASNLTFVEFKGVVTEIGKYAFSDCSLINTICYAGSEAKWNELKAKIQNTHNDPILDESLDVKFGISASLELKNLSNKTEFFTGDTIELSAAASDAPAGAEIIWTVDGKSAGNGTSFSYAFSKTGTAEIVAVLVDSKGNTFVEDSVTVTVNGREEKEYHFSDSESLSVSVSYDHDCFGDEKVELKVDKAAGVRDEHDFNIPDDLIKKQVGLFDIRMCIRNTDNEATIADGKNVKVRMEVPERYKNLADFRIVHYMKNNVREVFTNSSVIDEANNERPLAIIHENGKIYLEFSVTEFSDFELFVLEPETFPAVSIVNKDKVKTINYGETLHLTAKTTDIPADAKLFWYVDGVYKASGTTFDLSFKKGSVTVSVKLVDANGNDYYEGAEISDSQSVTVKAGFFQKLINFFKTLFGLNRTVIQTSGFYY